jgi:serine/threonine protein kinase
VLIGIVLALIHAHDRGILHGNLNPNCILLDENHRPKLCSFGIKRKWTETARYCAPEPEEITTKKMDVFAFSLILYEIIASKTDVIAVNVKERLEQAIAVGQSRLGIRWPLPGAPEFMAKLIVKGLEEDPKERPSIEDIFDVFEAYKFKIITGVNTVEVEKFLEWVEAN